MKFASYIASHARMMGDKDALVCGSQRMRYAELHVSTDCLAQSLRAQGVAVGDRVAIYLPNSVEFVQAFIAIVKAGAIAVPINLPLSAPEIAHILSDCRPKAAFISTETRATYLRAAQGLDDIRRIAVEEAQDSELSIAGMIAQGAPQTPEVPYDFDDCMICYTSGTTGKPKGAILTQANYIILNGFLNATLWGLSASDRHLATTPLAHRTGFARVANLIVHGSTLHILKRFDAKEATRVVREEKITVVGMVPTVGRLMLPEIETAPQDFASVKLMLFTGEAFPHDVKERLHHALPKVELRAFYAMTEHGGVTNLNTQDLFSHPSSVGRVIPGVELRLADTAGNEVPQGEVGEIWLRTGEPGRYLGMRGYFNRPKETAETIRDGWIMTGDMGRLDAEGYLYIMDRKKDMVLSGGYNIYSKEVELTLREHPAVREAAVTGVPDATFGEAVCAWVELHEGMSVEAETLIAHCRDRIASYKKPKYVEFVDELPRNSTCKVLKAKLREQFASKPAALT
jgi:long-chain acyl-CoA synthetase